MRETLYIVGMQMTEANIFAYWWTQIPNIICFYQGHYLYIYRQQQQLDRVKKWLQLRNRDTDHRAQVEERRRKRDEEAKVYFFLYYKT